MARLLSRLGRFIARHRWATVFSWILVLIALAIVALSGMKFGDGTFDVPGTPSSEAMSALEDEFPSDDDAAKSLQLVVSTEDHADVTAPEIAADIAAARGDLAAIDGVLTVSDPLDPARPYISQDLSTAVVSLEVDPDADGERVAEEVADIAAALRGDSLIAEVGGSLESGVPEIMGPSEIVGAVLAFIVLLITYGSLVAAGANMLGALVGVGVGILGVLGVSAITPIGSLTPILAVMLGLAVGIDYCLFILARFRSELREGVSAEDAIARAVGTAGSSVVFAGATVIIALAGLSVVGITFLGEMGLAAAFAVAVAVLMALTLLPAMLSFMGRRALSRKDRAARSTCRNDGGPFMTGWSRVVTRHRVVSLLGGALLLGTLALPLATMQTTLSVPGGEDPESSQRAAYDLISDAFGEGAQDPLVVLVRHDDVEEVLPDVQEHLAALDNVDMVVPAGVNDRGDVAMLTVMSEHGPLDDETKDLVRDLRAEDRRVDGAELLVTGGTAMGLDSDEQLQSALTTYIALIVGLSLLLMIVLFRSILVPLIATAGFLLSLGAGLGATVAVFQWGWLDALITSPQGNPLLSLLPIVVTGILFGLAMDYQVFLVSRMHEAHTHGMTPLEAIRTGFRRSAIVVVAAAAIMAAVFGGFAMSPSSLVGSIALALTVGVVADAFVVRMVLVPAALALLGKSAWWMPRWLDRIVPSIDVEGAALDTQPGAAHTEAIPAPGPAGVR
ncbi:MMPL family transporter [Microbacterium sp. JZ37]|uniref:MMPL family transporter n=1 Tax=Microbacterium sp. JZ37 TaxID=2654193 RepID=UPI002B4A60A3|nr:MMPL family transporter [Microbacterium sp. JZ37]WRH17793.1 MMPL family transporter [Microbacterium sp. JZ37]